ncbi:polysaccharide biosynthesis protein [Thiohalorhabdus sp.]|uniref:polysaccharide biosynthesis protein n=1 Tax=Thiohalorhabdus sp. TaxID=3094134 RepID=UPI002FC376B5
MWNRIRKRYFVVLHDLVMVAVAWTGVFLIRFDLHPTQVPLEPLTTTLPLVVAIQGLLLWATGAYRAVWRFASVPDAWRIIKAVALGTLAIIAAVFLYNRMEGIPRTVPVLYPVFLVLLLNGPRLAYRLFRDRRIGADTEAPTQRVLALGAGAAGEMLARDIQNHPDHKLVGFLDDSPQVQGAKIRGLPVIGWIDRLPEVARREAVDLIIIALPSASTAEMRRVVELCEQTGLPFRTLPRLQDLVSGKAQLTDLQEVAIEDLLGRDPVDLDCESIGSQLRGKTVLVSGGGGSIGSELCRQIAHFGPGRLVVVENCEYHLFRLEREILEAAPEVSFTCSLTDVRDREAVAGLFAQHAPDAVFHAAAYKHVPLLETHAREAIRNNLTGTRIMAEAADRYAADKFVLVSTDKAVNPTNVMGATKRAAEVFCQNLDAHSATRFITVRFGNVLDSAGSVIPTFREQIARGGPVTVTHPEITRYFMTIPEACQLILQAEAMGQGGEIFVLEMGEPIKIAYLAEQMVRLSGKEPGREIEIQYTGLRPGEKLYEELFHQGEELQGTSHQKILLSRCRGSEDWSTLKDEVEQLEAQAQASGRDLLPQLRQLVPEFQPEPATEGSGSAETGEKVVHLRPAEG